MIQPPQSFSTTPRGCDNPLDNLATDDIATRPTVPIERTEELPTLRAAKQDVVPKGPAQSQRELPAAFGRYQLLKLLGQGGMGSVYLGQDTQLERQVAIKVPNFSAEESRQAVEPLAASPTRSIGRRRASTTYRCEAKGIAAILQGITVELA